MALRAKVLQKKAEKFEVKELQKITANPERLSELGKLLDDAYIIRRPKLEEYNHRRALVRVFNEIANEIYGKTGDCPIVVEFGSFSMDLFSKESDLDMSVNFKQNAAEFPRDKKIRTLRKFAKKFFALQNAGHVYGVQPIMTAKVPILKVIDRGTGIECDLSIENRDGVAKSLIVHLISSIDERFHKLSFLTRNPPILPPFSALLKDGTDVATVEKSVRSFKNYGRSNSESLAELFVSLLLKLSSIEKLWPKGLCASTYEASWISKVWDSKVACMSVEDFTDRSQNVARAVGKTQVEDIYKCIQQSIRHISTYMYGYSEGPRLRDFLFGSVDVKPVKGVPPLVPAPGGQERVQQIITSSNPMVSMAKRSQPVQGWGGVVPTNSLEPPTSQITSFEHNLSKKIRVNDGWGGRPEVNIGGSTSQGWGSSGSWTGPSTQWWAPVSRDRWGAAQEVHWESEALKVRSQESQPTQDGWAGSTVQGSWRAVTKETDWSNRVSLDRTQVQPIDGWTPWGQTNHPISSSIQQNHIRQYMNPGFEGLRRWRE